MSERFPLLSADEAKEAAEQVDVLGPFADLNVFRALLQAPGVAKQYADFLIELLFRGELDARLRELIIMRLGWTTESVYEWTQHWPIALDAGISEADVLAVRDWRSHDAYSAADRAVLAATDETVIDGAVSAETFEELRAHVSEDPGVLVEVVSAIGLWRMISSVLRSLEVPLEEGVEAWPPDGVAPDGNRS